MKHLYIEGPIIEVSAEHAKNMVDSGRMVLVRRNWSRASKANTTPKK